MGPRAGVARVHAEDGVFPQGLFQLPLERDGRHWGTLGIGGGAGKQRFLPRGLAGEHLVPEFRRARETFERGEQLLQRRLGVAHDTRRHRVLAADLLGKDVKLDDVFGGD